MKWLAPTLLITTLIVSPGASAERDDEGYQQCILDFLPQTHTEYAAKQITSICDWKYLTSSTDASQEEQRHNEASDPIEHAVMPWRDVVASNAFQGADKAARTLMRDSYRDWIVMPTTSATHPDNQQVWDKVYRVFMERTEADITDSRHE